jgi:hypothetical protein
MKISLIALATILAAQMIEAQSSDPIVVQAASAASTSASVPAQLPQPPESLETSIRLLETMKAANEEILAKQKAVLERLDEMQKAAEEMKAFAARG